MNGIQIWTGHCGAIPIRVDDITPSKQEVMPQAILLEPYFQRQRGFQYPLWSILPKMNGHVAFLQFIFWCSVRHVTSHCGT
ncbi:hypothetical protein GALMADRAFT_1234544 [Galerina marginata CBS 339.88]|uniref:Uncharacterized protein n=1 Tax=Galerina marginata (strain CBS 339.88) TaxID=685588 RepID=A0A067TAD9_GALM3|nr:hypothetical protein GALMADRAFT_1234544 [Galerina marginata CBS 339.88]